MAWKDERDQNIFETCKKNVICILLYAPNTYNIYNWILLQLQK